MTTTFLDLNPRLLACAGVLLAALAIGAGAYLRSPTRHRDAASTTIPTLRETVGQRGPSAARAAAVVELARAEDRAALPLLVATIEDDDDVVAGRAIAAVQHLLGVRYPLEGWPIDAAGRRRIAAMAREDMAALDGPGRAWWESHTKKPGHP